MKNKKMYEALTGIENEDIEKAYPKRARISLRAAIAVFLCAAILISVMTGIALHRGGNAPAGESSTEPTVKLPDGYDGDGEIINLSATINAPLKEGRTADEEFISAVNNFSAELLKAQHTEGENTLLSPLSAMYALSMTANGAEGETLKQMEQVLGNGLSIDELNEYLRGLYARLLTEDSGIKTANSIWIRDIFSPVVSPTFLEKNSHYYGADVYTAPFNPDTVKEVNKWAYDRTDGMIGEIIDGIEPNEFLLLLNSLLFESDWEEEIRSTYNGRFTNADGTQSEVIMMTELEPEKTYYVSDLRSNGFVKKLTNGCSFFALLPNEDMTADEYAASLNGKDLYNMLSGATDAKMNIRIPAFSTYTENDLTKALCEMGMDDAFSPYADFSEIGGGYLSQVSQNNRIDVTPYGVKAASVTVATLMCEGIGIIELKFNRPFVYGIMTEDGIPLFIGVQNEM